MNNDTYFNWLYVMGMHSTMSLLDKERMESYKLADTQVNVPAIILYEYINSDKN